MATQAAQPPTKQTLQKSLDINELLGIGVASIMGSGGFSLIQEGVKDGGPQFPAAIALVASLFQGASKVYEEAYTAFKSNTSESDIVNQEFGTVAQGLVALAITAFNTLSVSTILVFAAKSLFPAGKWHGQIGFALTLLAAMVGLSFKGIEFNAGIISLFSAIIVVLLVFASAIGLVEGFGAGGTPAGAYPAQYASTRSLPQSINYFFFVLAGFDALMKFVEESKEPDTDIPKSFYVSNALSTLLTVGVAYAYVHTLTLKRTGGVPPGHHALPLIIESALGKPSATAIFWLSIFLMTVTAFVCFLATSRYLYGLAEDESFPYRDYIQPFRDLSTDKVPWKAVVFCGLIGAIGILVNHTDTLVNLSDFFLTIVMILVSAAVTAMKIRTGRSAWIEGATTLGFVGILSTCCIGSLLGNLGLF